MDMDISYINGLLGEVRENLEYLDPDSYEEDIEAMQSTSSENDQGRMDVVRQRMDNLMSKLGANRDDTNRVRSSGTKSGRPYGGAEKSSGKYSRVSGSHR